MTAAEHLSAQQANERRAPEHDGGARDPVCGMTVDPATAKHRAQHLGNAYYFCSRSCRERFEAEPTRYLTPTSVLAAGRGRRHAVDLPDAPRDRARRTRQLPDLRHGAGADDAVGRGSGQPRTARHDTPVLGRGGAVIAAAGARDGCGFRAGGVRRADFAARRGVARAHSGDPGRAVVRRAVFPARLGLGRQPPAQHVHPDRARHRHRLWLQPGRRTAAGDLSAVVPHAGRQPCRSISSRRRSSSRWCCSARSSNCAPAPRPAARSARFSISRPRPPTWCATMAARPTSRSIGWFPATACGCGPARRCRSTASCSKARAPSTNRC